MNKIQNRIYTCEDLKRKKIHPWTSLVFRDCGILPTRRGTQHNNTIHITMDYTATREITLYTYPHRIEWSNSMICVI